MLSEEEEEDTDEEIDVGSPPPIDEDVIRCLCGDQEEDGFMIQCDSCLTWQHGSCEKITKTSLKQSKDHHYLCSVCLNPPKVRK